MWELQKSRRFQELRNQEQERSLSAAEQAELSGLARELEDAEAAYLKPARRQVEREREAIEAQNRALDALARRKEILVRRLHDFLVETQAERQAIERELTTLAHCPGAETDQ
jgi:hypothetical protein